MITNSGVPRDRRFKPNPIAEFVIGGEYTMYDFDIINWYHNPVEIIIERVIDNDEDKWTAMLQIRKVGTNASGFVGAYDMNKLITKHRMLEYQNCMIKI